MAEPVSDPPRASAQRLVLRNTIWLVASQIVGTPLSLIVNAVMARHLGPEDFGYIYLAGTMSTFGFLCVEWGQTLSLPAMVARDRSRAGELLGTAVAWRATVSVLVYGLLAEGSILLGYAHDFQVALFLVVLGIGVGTMIGVTQDTVRGFERTDIAAYGSVGQQLLTALFLVPTLLLGGRLRAVLCAQIVVNLTLLVFVGSAARRAGVGKLRFQRATLVSLLNEGYPFLFMGLAMALQPNVDAVLLSKLAPPETVGWHAAARKLVGALIMPASALIAALYPTLCRLFGEDKAAFVRSARGSLRTATVLVVPLAAGCMLYPDIGIQLFSRESFGPARDNLRVLSPFVFLLYFTMVLGTCLAAAGRQRAWTIAQCLCVPASAVLDPILIPRFQASVGNGGLGVCVSSVVSEAAMLVAGLWLAPRGLLDRRFFRGIALALLSGGAMAACARALAWLNPFVAAPISVAAYFTCLWFSGGLEAEQLQGIRDAIARKVRK